MLRSKIVISTFGASVSPPVWAVTKKTLDRLGEAGIPLFIMSSQSRVPSFLSFATYLFWYWFFYFGSARGTGNGSV